MQQPERKEEGAAEEAVSPPQVATGAFEIEPKAYAFDGWSMVPLEHETA